MVNVLGAVAQWEREATAERTSAALQVLKQQGRATGGVAPYGFQFIDGRRAWHQGEQETLAAIIEHRRAGFSWAKVADKLNATGHRTRTGGHWTRVSASISPSRKASFSVPRTADSTWLVVAGLAPWSISTDFSALTCW